MILLFLFLSFWLGISFRCSFIIVGLVAIGLITFVFSRFKKIVSIFSASLFLLGFGISFINIEHESQVYSGFVYEVKDNYFLINSFGEKLYVYEKEHDHEIGDFIEIEGIKQELSFNVVESQFDFKEFLNTKGIYKQLSIDKIEVKFANPFKLHKIKKDFLSHFDDNTKGVISSILFSEHLDCELVNNLEALHLTRLISASGIYVYLFLSIIEYFLKKKLKEKWAKLLSLGLLSTYLIFTFPRFTIIKIFVNKIFSWCNQNLLNKRFKYLDCLSITGFVFLLLDYHLAYQDSFILGYTIPILIMYSKPLLNKMRNWKQKIVLALIVYLFFIPFELKYFDSIEPFSFANQLIFSPYFMLIASLSLVSFYGIPIYKLIEWILVPLNYVLKPFSLLNVEIYAPPLNEWQIALFYVLFFTLFYMISIGFKPFVKALSWFSLVVICAYLLPLKNTLTTSVAFLNVGQGDACVVRKGNTVFMIDTGGLKYMDLAKDSLIPYFKKERIYQIDTIITTHNDNDHCGAVTSLKKNFNVKNVVSDHSIFPLNINGIKIENYNNHIDKDNDNNENSLVLGFNINKVNYLIMGDAPIEIENKIMDEYPYVPCDVLKVGHHGSKTSTSDKFIKFLKPREAIISVGKDNSYGHPNKSVLDILNANNVVIKRTDEIGTIFYSNYIFM